MDFELEVFEVYDETEPHAPKKRSKHTRKKCKQKAKAPKTLVNVENGENDISRSKSNVRNSDHRHLSLRESILNVFSKLVVWRRSSKYQVPDKLDSPHSSKDYRRGYIPCGKCNKNDSLF